MAHINFYQLKPINTNIETYNKIANKKEYIYRVKN